MAQCWRFYGGGTAPPYDSNNYEVFACGTTPEYRQATYGTNPGYNLYMDGVRLQDETYQYGSRRAVVPVSSSTTTPGFYSSGSCDGCKAALYDCLNGNCVQSTKYATPGIYASLSDCQAVCANGGACASGKQCVDPTTFCPPGQICIDQDEYSNLQGLIAKINSEVC